MANLVLHHRTFDPSDRRVREPSRASGGHACRRREDGSALALQTAVQPRRALHFARRPRRRLRAPRRLGGLREFSATRPRHERVWQNASFHNYADYAMSQESDPALASCENGAECARLRHVRGNSVVALPSSYHRRYLSRPARTSSIFWARVTSSERCQRLRPGRAAGSSTYPKGTSTCSAPRAVPSPNARGNGARRAPSAFSIMESRL